MDTINERSFEEAYAQLQDLLTQLQTGELTLEQMVSTTEQSQALLKHCQKLLDAAELRIRKLSDDGSLSEL